MNLKWIMVDVEADGPCPGLYSMVSLGAVVVERPDLTFYGQFAPISNMYLPEALAVSKHTREETLGFLDAGESIRRFDQWLKEVCGQSAKPAFISDNNGFDWQFVNYYFWKFLGKNPFGHSSTNLGSLYKGAVKNMRDNFKRFRKTAHTHHPVDDAKGNVEALRHLIFQVNIRGFS